MSLIFIVTHLPQAQANSRASIAQETLSQAHLGLEKIAQLESSKWIMFKNKDGQPISYAEMIKNPLEFKEYTLVTGKIDKVYSGFKMRLTTKMNTSSVSITVCDENDQRVLGRTSISLTPLHTSDASAVRKIMFENTVRYLAVQVEASLKAQNKVAKTDKKTGSLYSTLFSLFMKPAYASGGMLESFFTLFTVIIGVVIFLAYLVICLNFLVIDSYDWETKSKLGKRHPFANPVTLGITKVIFGAAFFASLPLIVITMTNSK